MKYLSLLLLLLLICTPAYASEYASDAIGLPEGTVTTRFFTAGTTVQLTRGSIRIENIVYGIDDVIDAGPEYLVPHSATYTMTALSDATVIYTLAPTPTPTATIPATATAVAPYPVPAPAAPAYPAPEPLPTCLPGSLDPLTTHSQAVTDLGASTIGAGFVTLIIIWGLLRMIIYSWGRIPR